ncbi:aldo/keto reductase [Liberiplasma polymorphum]|uniref:aldo/keto reductase n=1 Tax=Liberiplasma polymorphum TaxID=3374570 RepID=UPI0037708F4E
MKVILNNGVEMPIIGLGTFRSKDEDAYKATLHALKNGYRHIDTAQAYGNEEEIGRAIKDSGIKREELFITTKLWNVNQGYLNTKRALMKSLERLGLDYVDLYLIHWPQSYEKTRDSYQALEELYYDGYTRAIGVSNFNFHHLEHLMETAEIMPQINQVECHVYLQNVKLQEFCMKNGIYLEAYAPFLSHHIKELLDDEKMQAVAKKYKKSVPQIALRYLIQKEIIVIPKSITPSRIDENLNVFDFEIDEEDMKVLRTFNKARKLFPEPDNIDF